MKKVQHFLGAPSGARKASKSIDLCLKGGGVRRALLRLFEPLARCPTLHGCVHIALWFIFSFDLLGNEL